MWSGFVKIIKYVYVKISSGFLSDVRFSAASTRLFVVISDKGTKLKSCAFIIINQNRVIARLVSVGQEANFG